MGGLSFVKRNFVSYVDKLIDNKKISHTYLIEIGNYDDDYSYVISFVKMILCNIHYDDIPCSDNEILKLIDLNNYPDIKVIEPDGNMIKKGQLIDLQKEFSNKSLFNNKRIYIIKNAEKLNGSSANTILKFLEEPENDIIALLLTDNRYHVLDTILSRCQILNLKEDTFICDVDNDIIELFDAIIKGKNLFIRYNYFVNNIIGDKVIAKEKFSIIEKLIIEYLNYKFCGLGDFNDELKSVLNDCSDDKLLGIISVLEDNLADLEYNVNYKLWLDSLFSKLIIGG